MAADSKVRINVSGHKFELLRKTLREFPLTRLGKIATQNPVVAYPENELYDHYDAELNEYYFQRNPGCFSLVVSFYVEKVLHVPRHMCVELFQKETEYWSIPFILTDCCQGFHRHEWETMEGVRLTNQLLEKQQKHSIAYGCLGTVPIAPPSRLMRWRGKIWDLFENSESSKAASVSTKFISLLISR